MLPRLAYNPDLMPSGYYLFPFMVHFLGGRNFENIEGGNGSHRILRIKNQRLVPTRDNKHRC